MKKYDTNLASEYYTLSMLYRKGIQAFLTLGNKKAVDIIIKNQQSIITLDVKGIRGQTLFPLNNYILNNDELTHFFVFISYLNKIKDHNVIPECYIVPSFKINELLYKNPKGNRQGVSLASLRKEKKKYRDAWELVYGFCDSLKQPLNIEISELEWFNFCRMYNTICLNYGNVRDNLPLRVERFYKIQGKLSNQFPMNLIKLTQELFKYKTLSHINKTEDSYTVYNNEIVNEINRRRKSGEKQLSKEVFTISLREPIHPDLITDMAESQKLAKIETKDKKERQS
jgi:hypothetical protein